MRRKAEGFHITDRSIPYEKPRNCGWYWKNNIKRDKYYKRFRGLILPGYKTQQTEYLINTLCLQYEMQADIMEAECNLIRRYEEDL